MRTVDSYDGDLNEFLDRYRYQPLLTEKLDAHQDTFDQSTVNEIVLWKVNRYAHLGTDTLDCINELPRIKFREHRDAGPCLRTLLGEGGIDLPMASTIFRFRNRNAFQIIDAPRVSCRLW